MLDEDAGVGLAAEVDAGQQGRLPVAVARVHVRAMVHQHRTGLRQVQPATQRIDSMIHGLIHGLLEVQQTITIVRTD